MMDGYWDHMAQRGKPANPYSAAFFQQVCISEHRRSDCEREWWPHVDYFFNKCLHLYPGMAEAPGYRSEASLRAGVVAQVGNTTGNMGMNKTLEGAASTSATSSPARRRRCASSSRSWRARCASGTCCSACTSARRRSS